MHPDLERILSEDDAARAGVDAARSHAAARLEQVRAGIGAERAARLQALGREVDDAVAQIAAEGDREVERRRVLREQRSTEVAERTAPLSAKAADVWVGIVRPGAGPGEASG